jgi:hypothetical protein
VTAFNKFKSQRESFAYEPLHMNPMKSFRSMASKVLKTGELRFDEGLQ